MSKSFQCAGLDYLIENLWTVGDLQKQLKYDYKTVFCDGFDIKTRLQDVNDWERRIYETWIEGGECGVERYSLEMVKDLLNQIAESAGFEEDDGYETHCNAYRD